MSCRTGHWENNDQFVAENYPGGSYIRDYFDCGKYYFDGDFNVIEFPEGMALYNGSVNLAMANLEFPLGNFYDTPLNNRPQSAAAKAALNNNCDFIDQHFDFNTTTAFFGDYSIAKQYSSSQGVFGPAAGKFCGPNCVSAFKLKKNTTFLLMTDPYNIKKCIRDYASFGFSAAERAALMADYSIADWRNIPDNNPLSEVIGSPFHKVLSAGERVSPRNTNYAGLKALCRLTSHLNYGGIAHARSGRGRFAEIIMCNPGKLLVRNYKNPYDWQYQDESTVNASIPGLQPIISTMKKYKSLNLDWHGGDLYDHSVWTALHVESELINGVGLWPDITYYTNLHNIPINPANIIVYAFMHDIGKAGDGIFCYYDKPNHATIGGEYLRGIRQFMLKDGTNINLSQVLPFDHDVTANCAYMAYIHYTFGNCLRRLNDNTSDINTQANIYIAEALRIYRLCGLHQFPQSNFAWFVFTVFVGIVISFNDVKAGLPPSNDFTYITTVSTPRWQAYPHEAGTDPEQIIPRHNWNMTSRYLPFISNRSRKYKGADHTHAFNYDTVGIALYTQIRDMLFANGPQIYNQPYI